MKPLVGLLDVDAVEALPDRLGGAHRDVDHLARRLVEIEGLGAALAQRAVGPVLDDLPVAARHAVLADEQRLAGEHADPPVELGRQEFLRQQQVGFLEQFVGDALEFLRGADLVHAARERAVGNLDHQRQAQFVHRPRQVAGVGQHHGRRRRHLVGPSSSIRNTLLVQRIIEIGSSMTGMPSCQARRANR